MQRNSLTGGENEDLDALYAMGQLVCENVLNSNVSCLEISMDGTLLLIGDTEGKFLLRKFTQNKSLELSKL